MKNDKLLKDIVDKVNKDRIVKVEPATRELEALQKDVDKKQGRMSKYLTLYEDDAIPKEQLVERLTRLKEEKRLLEERMSPLRQISCHGSIQHIPFTFIKDIMVNFNTKLCNVASREQRKKLLHLLLSEITIDESRKIDTIKLKINEGIITYLTKGEGLSLTDSPSPLSMEYPEMLPNIEIAI